MKDNYTIDTEFLRLTVPNTESQQAQLEKSLIEEGCKEPIYAWNNIIVDGHKRYAFCVFEQIDFEVRDLLYQSREDVISWVCKRRLSNLDPTTSVYKYLTGKWYKSIRPKYTAMIKAGTLIAPEAKRGWTRTSKVMARDIGVSYSKVENREAYAHYMDKISEADPDIFAAIITDNIKATYNEIRMLAKPDQKMKRIIRSRMQLEKQYERKRGRPCKKKIENDTGIMLSTGIKEMPAFDPDMEINGLTLTIPSWMASIARAEQKTDMSLATDYAKRQLSNNLIRLEGQIQKTLEAIKCTKMEY